MEEKFTYREKSILFEESCNKCMELPNANYGEWSIKQFSIAKDDIMAWRYGIPSGNYIKLSNHEGVMMSNTPMERRTSQTFTMKAHGDVLICGLGIGMILHYLDKCPCVTSVTVLEKSSEVILLNELSGRFSDKIKIEQADAFEWKSKRGVKYDSIFIDIWPSINSDIYEEEMKPLKKKYRSYLRSKKINPNRYIEVWAEWYAKNNRQLI